MTKNTLIFIGLLSIRYVEAKESPTLTPQQTEDPTEEEMSCRNMTSKVNVFLQEHFVFNQMNMILKKRLIKNFFLSLDPKQLYFTRQDVRNASEPIQKFEVRFQADCSFLKSYQIYDEALKKRLNWITSFLNHPNPPFLRQGQSVKSHSKDWLVSFDALTQERWIPRLSIQYWDLKKHKKHEEAIKELQNIYKEYGEKILKQTPSEKRLHFLNVFAGALDPYSAYYEKKSSQKLEEHLTNTLSGVGLELVEKGGFIYVHGVLEGGSAFTDGRIQPQDRLIAIDLHDGQGVKDLINVPLQQAVEWIRGEEGTSVTLIVVREKNKKQQKYAITLKRAKTKLQSLGVRGELLSKGRLKIGYIRIPSFYSDFKCERQSLMECSGVSLDIYNLLQKWKPENPAGYILDFRDNGGGSLAECSKMFGIWWPHKTVVMTMDKRRNLVAEKSPVWPETFSGPVIALINQNSASAAEIVPAAIQDWKVGLLIGNEHTFGKQSVQIVQQNKDGTFKITVAQFFSPSGHSYQGEGVKPDILVPSLLDILDIGEKNNPLALRSRSMTPPRDFAQATKGWIRHETITKIRQNLSIVSSVYRECEKKSQILKKIAHEKDVTKIGETPLYLQRDDLQSMWVSPQNNRLYHPKDYQLTLALDAFPALYEEYVKAHKHASGPSEK